MVSARLRNNIQVLISRGDTKTAISKLQRSKAVGNDPELRQYVTLLAAHYQQYKKDQIADVNAAEYQRKMLNRINSSILHLVNDEKDQLDRLLELSGGVTNAQGSGKSNSLGMIISAMLVGVAIILYFGGVISPNSKPEREPKISYELKMLDEQGIPERTFLVHIYDDLSGEFISNGNTQKISKITEASDIALDFTLFNNTDIIRYASFLPELSRVKQGNFTFLDGALYYNGQMNRKWRAYVK